MPTYPVGAANSSTSKQLRKGTRKKIQIHSCRRLHDNIEEKV